MVDVLAHPSPTGGQVLFLQPRMQSPDAKLPHPRLKRATQRTRTSEVPVSAWDAAV